MVARGQMVTIIGGENYHNFPMGSVVEVLNESGDGALNAYGYCEDRGFEDSQYIRKWHYVPATMENV